MDIDPDDVFRDDEDPENEFYQRFDQGLLVYLVDASPKMFSTTCPSEDHKDVSHFQIVVDCIAQSLRTQIINRSYDEVAICFFNSGEKKNLQDLNGVYVFNVPEREELDRPTARLIKEFDCIEKSFNKLIGSKYGISPGSRDNSLCNALWVAQALLRKGSAKTADKRILLFTNEDDPFGNIKGATRMDFTRTTLRRAKDAQDLGISIELLPLSRPDEEFNMTLFYAELLGLEGSDLTRFNTLVSERFEDMKDQLRKRMFRKRKIRRIKFIIANAISIELNAYALVRPTNPGTITWLDSVTNRPLKTDRSFICADTGALVQETPKYFQTYKNENIMFSTDELSEIKRVSTGHLRLLGFKSLSCLKDYHNLKPSTFLFPSDEEVVGSTCIFVALHRSMLRLKRFAVAFYGNSTYPRLVALVAQAEIMSTNDQVEPPGMHMIYLPYSDDIRPVEERHYAVLQALALDEDEMPEVRDETLPDEEGMGRPGVVKALEEFKLSVYGENYDEEEDSIPSGKASEYSRKRKAIADRATEESAKINWSEYADDGKLKDLTVPQLKNYLTANGLPLSGKKEDLINRILNHLGK